MPTKEKINQYHRSGPRIKLYDVEKVISIELTSEFQAAMSLTALRSQRASEVINTRHTKTMQWAEELPVPPIPVYSAVKLRELACQHYNLLWQERRQEKSADINSDDDFLDRISVNFLRHELFPYEEQFFKAKGRIGASEARTIIRERILLAIAEAYPWLSDECQRQEQRKNGL